MGVEQGDFLHLLGCNGDFDCGVGETCFVHPDAPSGLPGMCLRSDALDTLEPRCANLLTSARVFTIGAGTSEGTLQLLPRPATLDISRRSKAATTRPECTTLENEELAQQELDEGDPTGTLVRHTWACEATNTDSVNRCVTTCASGKNTECPAGAICQDHECVLGPTKGIDAECTTPLQNYELRAGRAFTVISSTSATTTRSSPAPAASARSIPPPRRSRSAASTSPNPTAPRTRSRASRRNPCHLERHRALHRRRRDGGGAHELRRPLPLARRHVRRRRSPGPDQRLPGRLDVDQALLAPIPSSYAFRFPRSPAGSRRAPTGRTRRPTRKVVFPAAPRHRSRRHRSGSSIPATTRRRPAPRGQILHYTQNGLDLETSGLN